MDRSIFLVAVAVAAALSAAIYCLQFADAADGVAAYAAAVLDSALPPL